ncbi:MAG: protein translocase subunit SecD, partial [Burkholderiales bacterium]|nr:protein translocase subunit SecD [Burkholderiales bacterium]
MNRYPVWVYITLVVALAIGLLYTLPNFYGESPAVQVSSARATVKIDQATLERVQQTLDQANIPYTGARLDQTGVKVRFADTDTQLRARDVIDQAFNPDPANGDYTVALNLLPASPNWLTAIGALPMYLGLDLRGGVHFLLQVDMRGAIVKRLDALAGDIRTLLRDQRVRHSGVSREGGTVVVRFRDAETRDKAREILSNNLPELAFSDAGGASEPRLVGTIRPEAQQRIQEYALKQNIQTLHNRINELGVAEPVIQQQGADRIV